MINKHRLLNLFKQLVRIDSLSLHEAAIICFLQNQIDKFGYEHFLAGKPKNGEIGSLIVDVPGNGLKAPRLLLNAHVDTVSPGEKIKVVTRQGYLYSNGKTILGADNKAGVAAILEILHALKKYPHPPLTVVFTVAEEIGLVGASCLTDKILNADFGLVLDGGDIDRIIYKAPSQINLVAKIFGQAAHAGIHPEDGINAIKVAAAAIHKMKIGRIDHETTANIGIIKGGKATNIVPDEVELKGEARSHKTRKLEKQAEHMENVLSRTCAQFGARLELDMHTIYKAFVLAKQHPLLQVATMAVKKAGLKPVLAPTGGGSDANIFNALGIPSIILGVGADRVHTTSERIAMKDLYIGTQIVFNIIQEAANYV